MVQLVLVLVGAQPLAAERVFGANCRISMSSNQRQFSRSPESFECRQADAAQLNLGRLGSKRLSVTFLLLLGAAVGVCLMTVYARPPSQPDHGPQAQQRSGKRPLPELPPVPTDAPMAIRWEKGPWWGGKRPERPSVSITNPGSQTIILGAAAAAMPEFLIVQDLDLAAPMTDPLTLVLVKAGTDHPLHVLDSCTVRTNTTLRVDNAALHVDGTFRVGGKLDLGRGRVAANSELLVGESAGAPALVNVSGGTLTVTNSRHNGRLIIGQGGRGDFSLNGGTVEADSLQITNNANNRLIFKSGTVKVQSLVVANHAPITIGDGIHPARLHLVGGTNFISSLLTISSNATLTGSGTIYGPVANYGTVVAGQPGERLTFASMPPGYSSAVTNWGRMYMTNGGVLSFQGTACNNVVQPITEMTKTSAGFTFKLVSVGGFTHTLEYKNAPSDATWIPLASTNGSGEIVSLTDPAPTDNPRYYHIRLGP